MLSCAISMPPRLQLETVKWGLPIAVAVLFGFIGAVFTWAKDWSEVARKGRLLDQASKRIDFWARWLDSVEKHSIPASTEQIAAAHFELLRTADVAYGALRFWPLPEKWTPDEYKTRWKKLNLVRRILLLYNQRDTRAQWERIGFYVLALGTVAVFATPQSPVFMSGPGGDPVPTSPYAHPTSEQLDLRSESSVNRNDAQFFELYLVCLTIGGRALIFSREWRWMTHFSGYPEWLRRFRARIIKNIAEENGDDLPVGGLSPDKEE